MLNYTIPYHCTPYHTYFAVLACDAVAAFKISFATEFQVVAQADRVRATLRRVMQENGCASRHRNPDNTRADTLVELLPNDKVMMGVFVVY
jgi:hypothetical protein